MAQKLISSDDAAIPRLAPLVPKAQEPQSIHKDTGRPTISKSATNESGVRRKKTGSISAEEWEAKKTEIHHLYLILDLPLLEVMKIMEEQHSFEQSRKQYITKLKQWGYEKNIKDEDMRAIVRKDLKRKAKDPLRPSSFRLRGRPVPNQRIERYKKEKGLTFGDPLSDAATPSDISCETPRSPPESLPSETEAPRGNSHNYGSSKDKTGWSVSGLNPNDQEGIEISTHDITIPQLPLPFHPDYQDSVMKQESAIALMDCGSGTLSSDHRRVDENDSIAKAETANEPQETGECKCSLCILTLTSDAPADPDMEICKPHSYQPAPGIPASVMLPSRSCQESLLKIDVEITGILQSMSLRRAISELYEEFNDREFRSSLPAGRPACFFKSFDCQLACRLL